MQIKVEQIQFKLNKFIYLKCFIWLFLTIWNCVTQMTRTSRSVTDTLLYGIKKSRNMIYDVRAFSIAEAQWQIIVANTHLT